MAPRTPARRPAAKPISTAIRGAAAGAARLALEEEKAAQNKAARQLTSGQPFRFYVPSGETRDVIVVDEEPSFFRNEHNLKNPRTGRFDIYTPCIDEHANCPVCASSGKPGYFAMYLTVIDLTPFTTNGGDEVDWSKKLMVVKLSQQKKIMRMYEREGNLRGAVLRCTRDSDKDASIGNDLEIMEFYSEEELEEFVTEYTDREDKVHEVIGGEPFDYDAIFPDMTEDELVTMAGGSSRGGRDNDDDRQMTRRPARANGRRAPAESEEDAGDAPSRPARGARTPARSPARTPARAEAPAPRTAPRRPVREAPQEEEQAAPRRPARATTRQAVDDQDPPQRASRAAPRRPSREESPLPDEPTATDRSSRRANLRSAR